LALKTRKFDARWRNGGQLGDEPNIAARLASALPGY
jgi:hypothetical protein